MVIAAPVAVATHPNFAAWVEELRTTDQFQCREYLADKPIDIPMEEWDEETLGFCCLGIGERLRGKTVTSHDDALPNSQFYVWLGMDFTLDERDRIAGGDYDLVLDVDPNLTQQGSLDGVTGSVYAGQRVGRVTAANLNDDWGLTFKQIADMLAYFGASGIA